MGNTSSRKKEKKKLMKRREHKLRQKLAERERALKEQKALQQQSSGKKNALNEVKEEAEDEPKIPVESVLKKEHLFTTSSANSASDATITSSEISDIDSIDSDCSLSETDVTKDLLLGTKKDRGWIFATLEFIALPDELMGPSLADFIVALIEKFM